MGICQLHHSENGMSLVGCPPHAEVIMNGIFSLFRMWKDPNMPTIPKRLKLERMLKEAFATLA